MEENNGIVDKRGEFKVIHFTDGFSLKEINDYLGEKNNVLYFTRTQKNGKELHVVKHNKNSFFRISTMMPQLLKHYEGNKELLPYLKSVKVKGNDDFAIMEGVSDTLLKRLKNDLNKLLIK